MKILIVDGEEGIRNLLVDILRPDVDFICSVENSTKALAAVQETSFKGAFIGMQMPEMDGLDTFRALKKLCPEIVITIMTGGADPERVDEALREGAIHCLRKPFTISEAKIALKNMQASFDSLPGVGL